MQMKLTEKSLSLKKNNFKEGLAKSESLADEAVEMRNLNDRATGLGEFSQCLLWKYFCKITQVARIFGLLFHGKSYLSVLTKMGWAIFSKNYPVTLLSTHSFFSSSEKTQRFLVVR
jgi:hypothetical protein